MSGFYVEDVEKICTEAERLGLHFENAREQNRWACVKFSK